METFLFKVPLADYIGARLTIDWPWSYYFLAVLAIALIVYLALGYLALIRSTSSARSITSWLIKTAIFSLLLFLLLRPTLRLETSEPAPDRLAIVLDNSISMTIADGDDGTTRAQQLLSQFDVDTGAASNALRKKFEVEHYRFDADTERLQKQEIPDFNGPISDSGRALAAFATKGISTLVLVSDGNGSGTSLDTSLDALIAAGVRVFTVGVGAEYFEGELGLNKLALPEQALTDDVVVAEIDIAHRGLTEESVELVVEEDGAILKKQQIILDSGKSHTRVSIPMSFDTAGQRQLSFRLPGRDGELISANNTIERSINITDEKFRILHFEGEPRFEVKFIRRALSDDANIRLTSLIRTADSKFFRIGLEDKSELIDGFPTEREELYRFDAVILGSVDRSLMSDQQLELLREFVSVRGGGLLLLGGAGAFAEGGYTDSVLQDMLPVQLEKSSSSGVTRVKVSPTSMGDEADLLSGVVTQTGVVDSDDSMVGWQKLPELTIINPIRRAKAGATVLLEGYNQNRDQFIVLATHRYGYGTVAALPVRDTWRWQINAQIEPDDTTHEALWRRLLRTLVTGSRRKLEIRSPIRTGAVGQNVELAVATLDRSYEATTSSPDVKVEVTTPGGLVETITANAIAGKPGYYRASVSTPQPGRYEFKVPAADASIADDTASSIPEQDSYGKSAATHIDVEANGNELRNAERNSAALKHIAERTGGAYFDITSLEELPDQIDATQQTRQVSRRVSLASLLNFYFAVAGAWPDEIAFSI